MGEPLANYAKSLDCRCELASEARTNTGNELLSIISINIQFIMKKIELVGIHGEHTESIGGVYDISNKIRIGRTEWDLINTMFSRNGLIVQIDRFIKVVV